ncbi:MAG: lipopolysaccharide biosynthesis protein [Deltaproteobacteria bacterium]|nr:lipopolysaccharide biosynthesis protein [Deltaproteobacteria bacterium]
MEEQADIHQYWDVIKRRRWQILVPAVVVFGLCAVIAFVLPPVYKSSATILIEAQEVPQDLVRTTVTGYVEERIQMITQIVLSRSKLLDIINRFGLYEDLKDRYTTEEIVDKMREDITMEPIQTEVVNPRSGRPGSATIAFKLSFEAKDPTKAAQVANTLVSLYLEENLKNREEKAQTTVAFLESQLQDLRTEISETEAKIAEFKNKHMSALPELMQVNLQTMERLQRDISAKEEQIKSLANRKIYLEGQLATVEPVRYAVNVTGKRVMTPREELETLRSEYLGLRATLSDGHPDVIALKKKLDVLETEVATQEDLRKRYAELKGKEAQLAVASEKFSDKHPDVIRLKKEVARLQADIDKLSKTRTVMRAQEEKPENPAYINLQTQISSTDMEMKTAKKELTKLKEAYASYQKRVESTPQVEQQYRALERDYANAQQKYQETLSRLMAAKEARGLEESRMGERFTLVDPPITPEKPDRPNRLAILLIGLVLGIGAGVGFGSMAEYLDQSVRRADDLARVAGHPVLAVIPYLETAQDRSRRLWKRIGAVGATVAVTGLGLAAIHYFYRPLDVLWVQIMRNLYMGF